MNLHESDFQSAAELLHVPSAVIKAIASVESSGRGFLPDGRPEILFEAHVFSRLTGRKYDATHPNISAPRWDRTLYGKGGAHQWDRMEEARALDADAALKSASWGLFQIMGENHARCGYWCVADFADAMADSEGRQLSAFCRFVAGDKRLIDAANAKDWATFARIYNGPDYKENKYDDKLAAAYNAAVHSGGH